MSLEALHVLLDGKSSRNWFPMAHNKAMNSIPWHCYFEQYESSRCYITVAPSHVQNGRSSKAADISGMKPGGVQWCTSRARVSSAQVDNSGSVLGSNPLGFSVEGWCTLNKEICPSR